MDESKTNLKQTDKSRSKGDNLQGYLLIAMPSLEETFFERSVIYVCEHDEKGAMGLIINRPIGIELEDLLEQMGLNPPPETAFILIRRYWWEDRFHPTEASCYIAHNLIG